jgi:hypothetical protein
MIAQPITFIQPAGTWSTLRLGYWILAPDLGTVLRSSQINTIAVVHFPSHAAVVQSLVSAIGLLGCWMECIHRYHRRVGHATGLKKDYGQENWRP